MSIAERYLGFATPPVISSSSFTTEFIEYLPQGAKKDFGPGDSFAISLSNLNKAQFLLPDSTFLTFDVQVSAEGDENNAEGTVAAPVGEYGSIDKVPRPYFGCPYFEQVTCNVPGSANFDASPSSADQTAAYWYSTRLLASSCSAEGSWDKAATFRLPGRYNFAGGKSGQERQYAISGTRAVRPLSNPGITTGRIAIRGGTVSYAIPLSAWCTLFAKASSLIPIGYLSSGGEALVFQYTVARVVDDIVGPLVTDAQLGGTGFKNPVVTILNPRIVASVVRIQDPTTVAQLSALYDARVKMALPGPTPDSPPMELAVPMVVAHKRFLFARTLIPAYGSQGLPPLNSSSPFSLTFSGVNEPSVSAIVLRFRYRPTSSSDSLARRQRASVFLGGDEPPMVVQGIQARINDQLIPLRGISDEGATSVAATIPSGSGAQDPTNGPTIVGSTSAGLEAMLFDLGRHGLSLFMEDSHVDSLSAAVFDKRYADHVRTVGIEQHQGPPPTVPLSLAGTVARTDIQQLGGPGQIASLGEFSARAVPLGDNRPIGLIVIPLCSMPQLVGDYSNAHTLRSWDLRSVSSFTVSGSVQAVFSQIGQPERSTYLSALQYDTIVDGALVCDGMLRLAAGSSDSRYQYTAVANATVSAT